jgi:hypothetical protein
MSTVSTKRMVADKIAVYLQGKLTVESLVDCAENALLEGEFAEADTRGVPRSSPAWALRTYGLLG